MVRKIKQLLDWELVFAGCIQMKLQERTLLFLDYVRQGKILQSIIITPPIQTRFPPKCVLRRKFDLTSFNYADVSKNYWGPVDELTARIRVCSPGQRESRDLLPRCDFEIKKIKLTGWREIKTASGKENKNPIFFFVKSSAPLFVPRHCSEITSGNN